MPLEELMWVEKYRPHKLEDLVNQESVKERLAPLIEKPNELPHLLFSGPPGTGKTTAATIIARSLLHDLWGDYTLSLNASDERGIDMVRERVKIFASYSDRREGIPFRLVILDEADEMCLHPDTRVLVGKLDDLREASLQELLDTNGDTSFNLPTFGARGMRLENDSGRIVRSGRAKLYRVTLEDGRSILASADHPFFTIRGQATDIVRTRELDEGSELADFSDKFLRCYNCSRPFYRQHQYKGYVRHFCSAECKNSFFGSISVHRTLEERREIGLKGARALAKVGVYDSEGYRTKRSEIARNLIKAGRIPDPTPWTKYRKLVESGFFKLASMRAYLVSVQYWKDNGFRSLTEAKMAQLLDRWKIPYQRERLILRGGNGKKYPFTVDFVLGQKIALLVNGCWWHVCPSCGVKAQYEKQLRNMENDQSHTEQLERLGYRVIVVWEHELKNEGHIHGEVMPRIFEVVGIAGGAPPKILHSVVRSVDLVGDSEVLNISVTKNKNFLLSNGILTHNTRDAQTALRRIMEESSKFTRFILICNYSSGIIDPIQSRCAIFRFQRIDEKGVIDCLARIAKSEKVKVSGEGVLEAIFEATNGDLRQAINHFQAASAGGEVTVEKVRLVTGATVRGRVSEIVSLALDGDFSGARLKLVELTRVYGVPESDFLKYANEEIVRSKPVKINEAMKIIAEYDYRLILGANPEIQLSAMLAELSALGRGEKPG
jgi:DNA polymerase III delta prime subunit/G:T-mismatch repair DNA endonuclease (very short patch repair protein)